jgi:DNA-binding transcriptional LysR family regulator
MPQKPSDILQHDVIMLSQSAMLQDWVFESATGTLPVRPLAQLVVNSADVAIAAAVTGRGLTRVLSYQIAPELKAGQLKIVLAEFEPPALPVHVVHVAGRRASARVRALVDFMAERLRKDASLNHPGPFDDPHHYHV